MNPNTVECTKIHSCEPLEADRWTSCLQIANAERVIDVFLAALSPMIDARFAKDVSIALALLERQRMARECLLGQYLKVGAAQTRGGALKYPKGRLIQQVLLWLSVAVL